MQIQKMLVSDEPAPPLLPAGEDAYRVVLSDGSVVYASCWTDRDASAAASSFGIIGAARAITADGNPVLKADGSLVYGQHSHATPKSMLVVGGILNEAKRQEVHQLALSGAIEAMLAELAIENAINL